MGKMCDGLCEHFMHIIHTVVSPTNIAFAFALAFAFVRAAERARGPQVKATLRQAAGRGELRSRPWVGLSSGAGRRWG
jgi:hypothetical protein